MRLICPFVLIITHRSGGAWCGVAAGGRRAAGVRKHKNTDAGGGGQRRRDEFTDGTSCKPPTPPPPSIHLDHEVMSSLTTGWSGADRGQAKGFEGDGVAETEELHEKHRAEFASIDDALLAMARGEFVVVLDDEDRENEGDLIIAADKMTPEAMGFMVSEANHVPAPRLSVKTCAAPLCPPARVS
jgi:hypothetical protein